MNIKKTNIKTTTYQISKNFFVDVQTNTSDEKFTNFFLYRKGCGIKEFIAGLDVEQLKKIWKYTTMEEVIEHIIDEDDMYSYYEEYIKDCFVFEENARKEIEDDFDILDYEDELESEER